MSTLRRRKAGAPPSLLAAVAASSGADSKDSGKGKDAANVGFVPQKPGATWLETHQWGLVPLLVTLAACEWCGRL